MAVTPLHGKNARIFVDERDLSPFLKSVTVTASLETADVTTFADADDRAHIKGLRSATFSFDGLFSAATAGSTDVTSDIANWLDDQLESTAKNVLTLSLQDSTHGRAQMLTGDITAYDISNPVDELVTLAVDYEASGGYSGGVMLMNNRAFTTTGSSTKYTTKGSTASTETEYGSVAHVHFIGGTTATMTALVQHTTSDGSTWATLHTFTASSGNSHQRITSTAAVKECVRGSISAEQSATAAHTISLGFSRHNHKT